MPEKKRRKPRHAGRNHEFTNREQESMCFYVIAARELGLPLGIERMLTNLHGTVFQLSSDVDVRKFATIGFKKIKDLYVAFLIYTESNGDESREWEFILALHEDDGVVPVPEPFISPDKATNFLNLPQLARAGIGRMYLTLEPDKWQEARAIVERSPGWQKAAAGPIEEM